MTIDTTRSTASLGWTIALFGVGMALCIGSYLLFQESFAPYPGVVQPLEGTDLFLVGDPAVTGSRTIGRVEFLLPGYLTALAPWLGGIGLATIVANIFRVAGFDLFRHRSVVRASEESR